MDCFSQSMHGISGIAKEMTLVEFSFLANYSSFKVWEENCKGRRLLAILGNNIFCLDEIKNNLGINIEEITYISFEEMISDCKNRIDNYRIAIPVELYYYNYITNRNHFCYHMILLNKIIDDAAIIYDYSDFKEHIISFDRLKASTCKSNQLLSRGYRIYCCEKNQKLVNNQEIVSIIKNRIDMLKKGLNELEIVMTKLNYIIKSREEEMLALRLTYMCIGIIDKDKSYYRKDIINYYLEKDEMDKVGFWNDMAWEYKNLASKIISRKINIQNVIKEVNKLINSEIRWYENTYSIE